MRLSSLALGVGAFATAFGATIDISTGIAPWQVFDPSLGQVPANILTVAQQNIAWAPAPASIDPGGSSWVSWGILQGTSCVYGQTPGDGCSNIVSDPNGDLWVYSLRIPASDLGDTSGVLNFIFGGDNRVNVFVGNGAQLEAWNTSTTSNGIAYERLGCSGFAPTDAGNTQASYNNCNTTIPFTAGNLNGDGSLTITAYDYNDPIPRCPTCGNPSAFLLEGTLTTVGNSAIPEPATFGLVGVGSVVGLAMRRRRRG